MYREGEYDLAGFGVGIVERSEMIDGSATKMGDVVLGIESSGLHSNGYSLVRKVLTKREMKGHSDELLKPTCLYAKAVLAVKRKLEIKGIANITGGAFYDKIPRIIPKGMAIEIKKDSWPVPWIFSYIRKKANADDKTMYRTFNMGIGMVLVLSGRDAAKAGDILRQHGFRSYAIGRVVKGNKEVTIG
jgi:phosphoribosylformylglycinamidine cyclo-ligase